MTKTREPIQIGAELYGHAGIEADLEVLGLLASALAGAGVTGLAIDIGHPGIYRALVEGAKLDAEDAQALFHAVQQKDMPGVTALAGALGAQRRDALARLTRLHGGVETIARARSELPPLPGVVAALDAIDRLTREAVAPNAALSVDLAELGGFNYESGIVYAAFAPGSPDALARGGRYDDVGRSFGRARAATGWRKAILAPVAGDAALGLFVAKLRDEGEIVIANLPGHDAARAELGCDRAIENKDGRWQVVPLKGA
jgi:ATP phosphoribosyltransferase regulatory subunit